MYPECLEGVKIYPILGELQSAPSMPFPLDETSPYLNLFIGHTQQNFNKLMYQIHAKNNVGWSIGGYLENRTTALSKYPMAREGRFYHLGIDINAPAGTPLYAPLDCEVVISEYEKGEGNYGGMVVLKCRENGTVFYVAVGHLAVDSLPRVSTRIKAGQQFAVIGDFAENGNYFYHAHLQILTTKGFREGWAYKGYCKAKDVARIKSICPNPSYLVC